MLLGQIILIAVVLFFIRKIDKRELKETGMFFNKLSILDFFAGCLITVFSVLSVILIYALLGSLGYKVIKSIDFNSLNDINTIAWVSFGFVLFILVSIQEELLCRGYMITDLLCTNRYLAIIFPAVIFSLMHLANPQFSFEGGTRTMNTIIALCNILIIGLILGAYFLSSKNLWPLIGFHFAWNFIQGTIFGLNVSGIEMKGLMRISLSLKKSAAIFTGGAIGPEGSVVVLSVNIITALLFYMYFKLKKKINFISFHNQASNS
ncbi:MAG: lysostaphin resistance A-like protein [Ignavibacteriales bacterium]